MTPKKSQVWIDASLARECRIMAAKRGLRVTDVASDAIRAGLLLAKKSSAALSTSSKEAK
jgi:hypothetical protein